MSDAMLGYFFLAFYIAIFFYFYLAAMACTSKYQGKRFVYKVYNNSKNRSISRNHLVPEQLFLVILFTNMRVHKVNEYKNK